MTDLQTAAQQALEALSEVDNCTYINDYGDAALDTAYESGMVYKAIAALRAALAEPVQGPVAWIQPDHLQKARIAPFLCRVEPTQRCADFVPLYLAPPQRQPLTEEEILKAIGWERAEMYMKLTPNFPIEEARKETIKNARAIERAHGIKE